MTSLKISKKQWGKWTAPSKYTVLSFFAGLIIGLASMLLSFYFWLNPKSAIEPIALPAPIFRSAPIDNLTINAANEMIKKNGFFNSGFSNSLFYRNKGTQGFNNHYDIKSYGLIVVDYSSGLMWDRHGSNKPMTYGDAKQYVNYLNATRFAGYDGWRLPTLEEAMSLMEPNPSSGNPPMHVSEIFDLQVWTLWTADKLGEDKIWLVHFIRGECYPSIDGLVGWVRGVR